MQVFINIYGNSINKIDMMISMYSKKKYDLVLKHGNVVLPKGI